MGKYINPANMTKEEWLNKNARVENLQDFMVAEFNEVKAWIVWLDNQIFTAAAYCFCDGELKYFQKTLNTETRPYKIYSVPTAVLQRCKQELGM